MELSEAVERRRSVRGYTGETVQRDMLEAVLSAGMKAPSGKNGQPWKFLVVQKDKILLQEISKLTIYDSFVRTANCLILIFLDKLQSYHYIKDCQAVGACIENMLLTITDLGLAACWIGEILNRDLFVKKRLKLDHRLDLMAVLAVGYPGSETQQPQKKQRKDCLLNWL